MQKLIFNSYPRGTGPVLLPSSVFFFFFLFFFVLPSSMRLSCSSEAGVFCQHLVDIL